MANFLSISLNQTNFFPLFAWSQLDISAIADSVSAVSEGYKLNYYLILKLLSGPRIFKLLNLCGNQLISIPWLLMSLFLLFFGENIPTAEFGMISSETAWDIKKKIAKFLMRTFSCGSTFFYSMSGPHYFSF